MRIFEEARYHMSCRIVSYCITSHHSSLNRIMLCYVRLCGGIPADHVPGAGEAAEKPGPSRRRIDALVSHPLRSSSTYSSKYGGAPRRYINFDNAPRSLSSACHEALKRGNAGKGT